MAKPDEWIGFDFDGTLVKKPDRWKGLDYIGPPIEPMVKLARKYIERGVTVKIVTARATREEGIAPVKQWCIDNLGKELEVTNQKDMGMKALYDDRAKQVIPNTGILLEEALISMYESIK